MERMNSIFYFSHQEVLFARAGILVSVDDITPSDVVKAMKEVEEYQKRKYGYECVRVVRNKHDPMMVDVYVKRDVPETICDYKSNKLYKRMNLY